MQEVTHPVSYAEVRQALAGARLSLQPAEAHGWLCGALCGSRIPTLADWLEELRETAFANEPDDNEFGAGEPDTDGAGDPSSGENSRVGAPDTADAPDGALHTLYLRTLTTLQEGEMQFLPLLPDDDVPLEHRTATLAQWCEGFLYGFGTHEAAVHKTFSAEVQEIVRDFAEISRVEADGTEEPTEEDEQAYTELVEFVRVSVQLVHDELTPPAAYAHGISTDAPN